MELLRWAAEDDPRWWLGVAACRGADPEVFFPPLHGSFTEAKRTCEGCGVIAECRAFADRCERDLPVGYLFGFIGGESPLQRARRRASA